jgi:hypothetical protein
MALYVFVVENFIVRATKLVVIVQMHLLNFLVGCSKNESYYILRYLMYFILYMNLIVC